MPLSACACVCAATRRSTANRFKNASTSGGRAIEVVIRTPPRKQSCISASYLPRMLHDNNSYPDGTVRLITVSAYEKDHCSKYCLDACCGRLATHVHWSRFTNGHSFSVNVGCAA